MLSLRHATAARVFSAPLRLQDLALAALLVWAGSWVGPVPAGAQEAVMAPPLVRIVVGDSALSIPDILPSGRVRLRLVDHAGRAQRVVLTRLRPRQSASVFLKGAQRWLAGGSFGLWGVDPGTPGMVAPGDSTEAVVRLDPGHYVLARWSRRPDGSVRIGMATKATFEVLEPPAGVPEAAAPASDLSVRITDDAYRVSGPLTPGRHVVKVANYGLHEHDFELVRLLEGYTAAEARKWLTGGRHGPAPVVFVGGLVAVSPGYTGYVDVRLEPGRYLAVCLVPAGPDREPRVGQGMLAEMSVAPAAAATTNGSR